MCEYYEGIRQSFALWNSLQNYDQLPRDSVFAKLKGLANLTPVKEK